MTRNAHGKKTGDVPQSFFTRYFHRSWNPFAIPFVVVLLISLFVVWSEETRVMVEMRSWSLDLFWAVSHFVHRPPATSNDIFIVGITDSDYRNPHLFDSRSPLDPDGVKRLLTEVLSQNPKVVAVDLDTKDYTVWARVVGSHCQVQDGSGLPIEIYRLPSKTLGPKISLPKAVWARLPVESGSGKPESPEQPIQLYQVLGGCAGDALNDFSGVPRFPLDADGVVRRYVDEFRIDNGGKDGKDAKTDKVGSFAYVVAEKYRPGIGAEEKARLLNFGNKKCFQQITAGELLGKATENVAEGCDNSKMTVNDWKNKVQDQIVLIGGEFEDSRDAHDSTPAEAFLPQPLFGVELNAMAIDTDLNGGAITEIPRLAGFFLDLLVGTLFVWIFFVLVDSPLPRVDHFIQHPRKFWILKKLKPRLVLFLGATVLTFLIAIGLSWAFYLSSHWMSFIPILLGANIHQYIAHAEKIREQE
jgi:CHASE2 domain-containing sensor protein